MQIDEGREIARAIRRRKSLERLGFNKPKCLFCDEDDPRCLQLDHIAGKAHSDDVWPVCLNDHMKRSDMQKDHPPKAALPRDQLEVIGRFLEGVADFLELIATRLREYGPFLMTMAASETAK